MGRRRRGGRGGRCPKSRHPSVQPLDRGSHPAASPRLLGSGGAGVGGWVPVGCHPPFAPHWRGLWDPSPSRGGFLLVFPDVASPPGACSADADTKPEEPRPSQVSKTPSPLPSLPIKPYLYMKKPPIYRCSHPLAGGGGRPLPPTAARARCFGFI